MKDTSEWEEIQTEIPPPARNFHSMVEHEKIFYLYGGKSNGYHGGLHQFNLETNTWHHSHYVESTQEGNWPIPRFGHSAIVHKEEIIIYGGYDADGYCSGDIYCYSIQENIWKRIIHSNQELELERFHHAACTTENSMLVFGGKSSKGKVCENTLLSYHYDTDTWSIIETVGTAPCRRWGHCSATQGGYMYIFGGYDGHSEFADLYQYNFNSRTWMIVEVDWCPAPRYFSSAVSIDGTIYVYGGKNQISKCFGDVYAIQLESPQATIKEKKRKQKKDKEKRNSNSTEKQRGKKNWEKKKRKPAGGETMKVKCYFQGEIRILGIPRSMTYEELMDKLTTEYCDSLLLQYNGTNGDVITVRSQSDMDKMRMRHRNTHSMKVYLTSYYPSLPYMDAGTIPKHPLEKVQVTKTLLGKGGVGEVYLGMNFDTGELIAVKQVRVQGTDAEQETIIKSLQQEIQVMQKLNHVNIVRYLGSRRSEAILNIYLEFVPGGSIHHLLTKFGHFSEEVTRLFTYQILCGLDYLHDNRIVHRDIKGANILVDNNGTIKLSDFGAAKQLSDILSVASTITGTPHWVAPEVANGEVESYGRKADIWSLGAVIIEMITGKPPFSDLAPLQALVKLGTTNILPDIPDKLSPEGKTFLSRCFQRDPELRASTKELLEHPYMQSMGRESLTKSADDKVFVPRELLFNERMASPASGSMEAFQPSPDSYFSEFNSIVSFLRSSTRKAGPLK